MTISPPTEGWTDLAVAVKPGRVLHCKERKDVITLHDPQRSQCLGLVKPIPPHSGKRTGGGGPAGLRAIVTPDAKSSEMRGRSWSWDLGHAQPRNDGVMQCKSD
jgi:hypothetical protein